MNKSPVFRRLRAELASPLRRTILLLLLSPLLVILFLEGQALGFYAHAILWLSVGLYLVDAFRTRSSTISSHTPSSSKAPGRGNLAVVPLIIVFGIISALGFLGLVGAVAEGWLTGITGFVAILAIGLRGLMWTYRHKLAAS